VTRRVWTHQCLHTGSEPVQGGEEGEKGKFRKGAEGGDCAGARRGLNGLVEETQPILTPGQTKSVPTHDPVREITRVKRLERGGA